MTKKPRKIKSMAKSPKKRPVLAVARHHSAQSAAKPKRAIKRAVKKEAITLNLSVPSVVSDLSVLLKPQIQQLIPETGRVKPVYKWQPARPVSAGLVDGIIKVAKVAAVAAAPEFARQPLISNFISKQKHQLLPKAANAFKLAALTLVCIILGVPALSAFEAHVVNVTAQLKEITPPTLTTDPPDPQGGIITWDKPYGGSGFTVGSSTVISMDDTYLGAINIYYTFKNGTTSPDAVLPPFCGQPPGPNSGGGAKPQSLTITTTSVVKAIACDGSGNSSFINAKVYIFDDPLPVLVINEFLPHPAGGDVGAPGGHISGNGGEWVELFNNSSSTIDVTNFALTDTNNNFLYVTAANTTGSLVMAPGGFVVVYRDGDPNFELDTATSGAVSLFDASNFPIDSHNYSGPAPEGKSIARVPDASPVWFDPCPTPGQPNVDTECPALPVPDVVANATSTSDSTSAVDSVVNASSTPNSTTTTDTVSNSVGSGGGGGGGGNSGGSDISGSSDQTGGSSITTPPADATSTPDATPSTGSGSATTTPDNSGATPAATTTPDSNATSTPSNSPSGDLTGQAPLAGASTFPAVPPPAGGPPPPTDTPADPTKDQAIVPQQPDTSQAVLPAPISTGGDTPPPPPPPPDPAPADTQVN